MYKEYNPNPCHKRVGDCTVRAICKACNKSWLDVYLDLCMIGMDQCDMPSSNNVWGTYLHKKGFERHIVQENFTVKQFCRKNESGTYVLALQSHVVAVVDGDYYDMWDSGNEMAIYYWKRKEE